jgi:5'-nucleotidase
MALVQAVRPFGQVSVLAPDRNWSGHGHVKTLNRPLRITQVTLSDGTPAHASDGAPSDCVALALLGFIPEKIDLVVSGINPMANLGHDVTYSGTVTAVMESIIWGVPGVAFSLDGAASPPDQHNYDTAARVARMIVRSVLQHGLPHGVFLNANIPNLPAEQIKGIQLTRQGLRVYRDRLDRRQDPRGVDYFWIGGEIPGGVPEEGTDVGAVADGFISVTPLQLDLTANNAFPDLVKLGWNWSGVSGNGNGLSRAHGLAEPALTITPGEQLGD